MLVAAGACVSTVEESIPAIPQRLLVFGDQFLDLVNLACPKLVTAREPRRIEPKSGFTIVAFHMHMRRFFAIARIEEESVRAAS